MEGEESSYAGGGECVECPLTSGRSNRTRFGALGVRISSSWWELGGETFTTSSSLSEELPESRPRSSSVGGRGELFPSSRT